MTTVFPVPGLVSVYQELDFCNSCVKFFLHELQEHSNQ